MTTPIGGPQYQLAVQEAQNQQVLQQLAQREAQSASFVTAMAGNASGQTAGAMRQIAIQENQNVALLQTLAQREAIAASQLGYASGGGALGADGTTTTAATGTPPLPTQPMA